MKKPNVVATKTCVNCQNVVLKCKLILGRTALHLVVILNPCLLPGMFVHARPSCLSTFWNWHGWFWMEDVWQLNDHVNPVIDFTCSECIIVQYCSACIIEKNLLELIHFDMCSPVTLNLCNYVCTQFVPLSACLFHPLTIQERQI